MTADFFTDLALRSLTIGLVAAAFVRACPPSWCGWFRRAVPVAAFAALLLLALWPALPVERLELKIAAASELPAFPAGTWVVALWLAGAVLCAVRYGFGILAVRRLLKSTRPVPGREWRELLQQCQRALGLRGKVRLRLAGPQFVPSATGLLRRTVLLPVEALQWSPEERRLVLLHELGHFQRGDLWKDTLARIACALHWFNPFAWILQRQLALEREYACDALVVEKGAQPKDYAMLLWQMASRATRRPNAAAAFIAMASPRGGKLEQRVRRILNAGRKMGKWLRMVDAGLCAALTALLLACAACKPVARIVANPAQVWTTLDVPVRLAADPFPAD